MNWLSQQLGIKKMEDWYKVSNKVNSKIKKNKKNNKIN